jgi:hypothetical protein
LEDRERELRAVRDEKGEMRGQIEGLRDKVILAENQKQML